MAIARERSLNNWFAMSLVLALATSWINTTRAETDQLTGTVIVVNQASDTVTLIDLATLEAYRHVAVGGGPHEVAVSPDGRRAMVSNYRKRGGGPQKTLSLISLPNGVAWSAIQRR
jgi:YVTN family beta-propeller protein